jgi:hypothetical protein
MWDLNENIEGYLIALDIVGFGRRAAPDGILEARTELFNSVKETILWPRENTSHDVRVHFLGDELRLGFGNKVNPRSIRSFIGETLNNLDKQNEEKFADYQTQVRGVAFRGMVKWRDWRGAYFLDGPLAWKCRIWMRTLAPGEIVINESFRQALQTEGISTSEYHRRQFEGEAGYVLLRGDGR